MSAPGDRPAELELPKTRLRVTGGELVRTSAAGAVIMRLALDDIEDVRLRRTFDPVSLLFVAVGAGLAAVGFGLCEDRSWQIAFAVAALLVAGFGGVGAFNDGLAVRVRGEDTQIACADLTDHVAGFAVALRARVGGRSAAP